MINIRESSMPTTNMPSWFNEKQAIREAEISDIRKAIGSAWLQMYIREQVGEFYWAVKVGTNNYRFFKEESDVEAYLILRDITRPPRNPHSGVEYNS